MMIRNLSLAIALAIASADAYSQQRATPLTAPVSCELAPTWDSEQLCSCIRPHLIFRVPEGTSPQTFAEFKVMLRPDGLQSSPPMLVTPSGLAGFDDAAERAIRQCNPFPELWNGTAPPELRLRLSAIWPLPFVTKYRTVCHSIARDFEKDLPQVGLHGAADHLQRTLKDNDLWPIGVDQLIARVERAASKLPEPVSPEEFEDSLCSLGLLPRPK